MNKEEKEAIEKLEIEGTENNFLEVRTLLNLVNKQQEKNEKLEKIIRIIRNKLRYDVIIEEDGIYKPCKNLSKQEVYKKYSEIIDLLKADYCFMDTETAIKEILKEMGVN